MQQSKAKSLETIQEEKWVRVSELTGLEPPKLVRSDKFHRDEQVGFETKKPDPDGRSLPLTLLKGGVFDPGAVELRTKSGGISLPPQLRLFPGVRRTLAHQGNSSTVPVTVGTLLGAAGVIGTVTNSKVNTVFTSVRVRRIRIWPSPSSSGLQQSYVLWYGNSGNDPDYADVRPIPEGATSTGKLTFIPPERSLASFWNNTANASTAIFEINGGTNSVVYLDIELLQSAYFATLQQAVTTAVVGTMYYLALDGASSNTMPPIAALPTTH